MEAPPRTKMAAHLGAPVVQLDGAGGMSPECTGILAEPYTPLRSSQSPGSPPPLARGRGLDGADLRRLGQIRGGDLGLDGLADFREAPEGELGLEAGIEDAVVAGDRA